MVRLFFAISLLFGMCTENAENPYPQLSPAEEINLYDTVLPSGKYLDYWLRDSTIMITWGTHSSGKLGAIESEEYPGWAPHYYWCEFENYIGVRYSCGSPCWELTLLPIRKNDTIIHLMEDMLIDTKRGYVLANGCPQEELDFCLFDVNTQQHHPITLPGLRYDFAIIDALDTSYVTDEGLHLRWHRECNWGSGYEPVDTVIVFSR